MSAPTRTLNDVFRSPAPPAQFAVLDVETTGLNPRTDRVVQVAVTQVSATGDIQRSWNTLINPDRDPGPVHVHGLTTEALRAAPTFAEVAPAVRKLLTGRVLVAHNADFDWAFLAGEARRAGHPLPTTHRLCTVDFTRSLRLQANDYRLATLAEHFGIAQQHAHDARDDTRVLVEVFSQALRLAEQQQVALPLLPCTGVAGWATQLWRAEVHPRIRRALWRIRRQRRAVRRRAGWLRPRIRPSRHRDGR